MFITKYKFSGQNLQKNILEIPKYKKKILVYVGEITKNKTNGHVTCKYYITLSHIFNKNI